MKILYISSPSFLDADLSYLHAISNKVDIVYLMDLAPDALKKTVLNIDKQIKLTAILPAVEYKELQEFQDFIICDWYVINRIKGKLVSIETIKLYFEIKKFIKFHNPDVIHYNNPVNPGIFACLLNKYKKIITVHDPIPHLGDATFTNKLIRKLNFLCVKKYILLNQNQKQQFIDLIKCKSTAVYNSQLGVYSYFSKTYLAKQMDHETERLTILFFGRITAYKGIDVLLKSFVEIRKKFKNADLIIAGNGPFSFDAFDKTQVTIINRYIPTNELFELINKSTVVVCPYIEATQSGVVMTSFSVLKPIIATRVGGLPEMISNNNTGLIINPNSTTELINALSDLFENPTKLLQFSINIKKKYFNNGQLSWDTITNNLIAIYNEI